MSLVATQVMRGHAIAGTHNCCSESSIRCGNSGKHSQHHITNKHASRTPILEKHAYSILPLESTYKFGPFPPRLFKQYTRHDE